MTDLFESARLAVEAVAVLVLLGGLAVSLARYGYETLRATAAQAFRGLRQHVGRTLLIALELLIAADIIKTVAVEPSFRSLGILGLLVLIRTFLSFALQLELTGRWPWQGREEANK